MHPADLLRSIESQPHHICEGAADSIAWRSLWGRVVSSMTPGFELKVFFFVFSSLWWVGLSKPKSLVCSIILFIFEGRENYVSQEYWFEMKYKHLHSGFELCSSSTLPMKTTTLSARAVKYAECTSAKG